MRDKKFIINLPYASNNCYGCPLSALTKIGDIDCSVEEFKSIKDCGLTPLMPKQLEWIYDENEQTYKESLELYSIWFNIIVQSYHVYIPNQITQNVDSLEEAKYLCQEHYNKLFYKILEV